MLPLPSVKPTYPEEILRVLPPAERLAAHYGVERKFLRFASPPYVTDSMEQYSLHQYSTIQVTDAYEKSMTVTYEDQYKYIETLLSGGVLWSEPAGLIIINSPRYFFNSSDKDPDGGAEAFLSHLLCSLAFRVATRKAPGVDVNFLETMQLDYSRGYHLKPRHLLLWGVCTEHFNPYDCQKTIQFLFAFRQHTRILLTSVLDMGELLDRLHLHLDSVTYIFNLDKRQNLYEEEIIRSKMSKKPKPQPKVKKAVVKKTTKKKATRSVKKTKVTKVVNKKKEASNDLGI
jgi:hypothetical protein